MTGEVKYEGTLSGSDGSRLIVRDVEYVPADTTPTPDPTPDPAPSIPDSTNTVTIDGSSYPLAGVNPTRTDYPGGRGPDELVAYVAPVGFTTTNAFGVEASVVAGQVLTVIDREATRQAQGVIVPVGGLVLSGHGRARDWLLAHALKGAAVQLVRGEPVAEPDPIPAPSLPAAGRTVALYLKDGVGRASDIPDAVTQVRIAFAQGDPPRLTEWGGESTGATIAGLNAWRGPGRQVIVSVGGAGGRVNLGNRGGFLGGILAMEQNLGLQLDGWDVDVEGTSLPVGDVVAIAKALASGRESTWVTSFVPPGGPPVGPYLEAAVQCHRAGLIVQFGQQLYDAPVSLDAALSALARAVTAGLPASRVLIGMMVGSDSRHWTLDMCEQVARAARAKWPDLGGAYLWSERYTEDDEWARRMAAVLA